MTGRILSVVAATSVVLLLAGCSSHEPPPSYTAEERRDILAARVDAAWANSGLDGVMTRPVIAQSTQVDGADQYYLGFSNCITDLGLDSWGIDERDGGPVFQAASGGTLNPELQLGFYRCFAEFPMQANMSTLLLTPDQMDYLYDYYQRWVFPCLEVNDYRLEYFPSRADFSASGAGWIPYYAVVPQDGHQMDSAELEGMIELCGDPFADLDLERPQWY